MCCAATASCYHMLPEAQHASTTASRHLPRHLPGHLPLHLAASGHHPKTMRPGHCRRLLGEPRKRSVGRGNCTGACWSLDNGHQMPSVFTMVPTWQRRLPTAPCLLQGVPGETQHCPRTLAGPVLLLKPAWRFDSQHDSNPNSKANLSDDKIRLCPSGMPSTGITACLPCMLSAWTQDL